MSRKKLALAIPLALVTAVAIVGGIVYAQESGPMALVDDQDPGSKASTLSFFIGDGAFLGVGTEDISKENMTRYGMREVRGVGVTEVVKDSPAEKAGLRKDDVILRFEGEAVTSVRKLTRLVTESSPDQNVRLTISRAGSEQELSATLSKRKMDNIFNGSFPRILRGDGEDGVRVFPNGNWPESIGGGDGPLVWTLGANRRIGVSTQSLSKQLADYFGVSDGGVLITSVSDNSPASRAGLKAGDVITAIDGEKVTSPGDITRTLGKKETGDVSLTIVRDKSSRTVTVTPEKNPNSELMRPGTTGTRRIMVPSVKVRSIPPMKIEIPQINIPATPPIEVTVPTRLPRVVVRSRVVI